MKVRSFSALACAVLISVFASAAEARVETNSPAMSGYGDGQGSITRPSHAKNFKGTSGRTYAASSSRRTAANGHSKKRYAHSSSKKKSYASSRRSGSRLASRAMTAGRDDEGGSSRSCLQASARALLNRIEAQFGPVSIVSTCRPGAVIATSGKPSKHRNGMAIDFSAGGRKAAVVQWLIANHHSGGTMTYRDMDHIHVDVGYHFVSLGANSGRG